MSIYHEPSGSHGLDSKPIIVLGKTGRGEGAALLISTGCDKILASPVEVGGGEPWLLLAFGHTSLTLY